MLQPQPTPGDVSWFTHDRFGLFIHWGLYSLAARHEWVQNYERIAAPEYARYFEHFDPDLFDPRAWAKSAREAGMKYLVITAKHHEGFCLWDTAHTDFKATNTRAKRDLLREVVEAFRAEGLRVGFYYSLLDWHHPDFPIDHLHPLRDHPDALAMNAGRNMSRYAAFMRDQVRELLTQFGPIDILWFDFSYPDGDPKYPQFKGKGRDDWESETLLALVRELAPRIILNNRLDLPAVPADVYTPEQYQPQEWVRVGGQPVVWEACQTFSGSWGYHRDETSWKSPGQLIRMMVDTVSKGGNLLMNVGPTSRGAFDSRALDALGAYAGWMKKHERAVVGCTQAPFEAPTDVRYTFNPATNRLYVHVFAWPFRHLYLPGLAGQVAYAQLLHDGSEVKVQEAQDVSTNENFYADGGIAPGSVRLELPVARPQTQVPVIELFLR